MTHETLQEQIIARALKDAAFRQELLNNPRTVLAREYQVHLPEHVAVHVLEDAPDTLTLVLPAREEAVAELTDADLQGVSGGRWPPASKGTETICTWPPLRLD